jgi:putative flippase GtrA
MPRRRLILEECRLALGFGGVGLIGFAVDAALLHVGLEFGAPAWAARIVSLFCAMQTTFTINGVFVFRRLQRGRLLRQWSGYMLSNGFGNLCNYWIFLTMVSTHWPGVSNHYAAMTAGSFCAWLINFAGARLAAFPRTCAGERDGGATQEAPGGPSPDRGPAAPGWSRR